MAESDLVALPDGALDAVASRVGASLRGSTDGTGLRIGLACAEFNGGITLRLLDGALSALNEAGTDRRDVTVAWAAAPEAPAAETPEAAPADGEGASL
jgi:6,7-dimethyl-8-ribityllumazine synthase